MCSKPVCNVQYWREESLLLTLQTSINMEPIANKHWQRSKIHVHEIGHQPRERECATRMTDYFYLVDTRNTRFLF